MLVSGNLRARQVPLKRNDYVVERDLPVTKRTTARLITFTQPFVLESLVTPLAAGSYWLIADEELIEGPNVTAYTKAVMHLEIPAISLRVGKRQALQVSSSEISSALRADNPTFLIK